MTFFKFFMYRMQGVLAFLKTLNSYRGWLLFCLFNQSELTSLVTQCRVSEKMNMSRQPRKDLWSPPEGTAEPISDDRDPLVKMLMQIAATQ